MFVHWIIVTAENQPARAITRKAGALLDGITQLAEPVGELQAAHVQLHPLGGARVSG